MVIFMERVTELHSPGFIPGPKGVSVCKKKTQEQDTSCDTSFRCRGLNRRRMGQLPLTSGRQFPCPCGFWKEGKEEEKGRQEGSFSSVFSRGCGNKIMCC